jgi:hypothetical protein
MYHESWPAVVDEVQLTTFAAQHQIDPTVLRELIVDLQTQAGIAAFYIFWNSGSGGGRTTPSQRPRTLLAFPSPDTALAFAQHNHLVVPGQPARLRRLTLLQLFGALLREVQIEALLLVIAEDVSFVAGQLPAGITLSREAILGRLGIV